MAPPTFRRWFASWLIVALVSAQVATAAHACRSTAAVAQAGGQTAMAAMPCAQMRAGSVPVDAEHAALCFAHCRADAAQPPLDASMPVALAGPTALPLFPRPAPPDPAIDAPAWAAHEHNLERAPPLAHSILHCCYRD